MKNFIKILNESNEDFFQEFGKAVNGKTISPGVRFWEKKNKLFDFLEPFLKKNKNLKFKVIEASSEVGNKLKGKTLPINKLLKVVTGDIGKYFDFKKEDEDWPSYTFNFDGKQLIMMEQGKEGVIRQKFLIFN